jgi:hypothetical protein
MSQQRRVFECPECQKGGSVLNVGSLPRIDWIDDATPCARGLRDVGVLRCAAFKAEYFKAVSHFKAVRRKLN